MTATFELYEDKAGNYRWRLRHDNGNIIADSSEGYASKQKAKQGLASVQSNAPSAYVEDQSEDDPEPDDEGDPEVLETDRQQCKRDDEGHGRYSSGNDPRGGIHVLGRSPATPFR